MAGEHDAAFAVNDWLTDDPVAACGYVQEILDDAKLLGAEYALRFKRQMAVATVYTSNRLEATIPLGASEHETYKLLARTMAMPTTFRELPGDGQVDAYPKIWPVDGGDGNKPDRHQLEAHVLALKFLTCDDVLAKPLTIEIVKRAHYILMFGAYGDDGEPFLGGRVRHVPCHAGDHVYPDFPAEQLEARLERILSAFEATVSTHVKGATTLFTAPAALFYDIITLHPFENGNGRLCRLLLTHALMKLGVPFPVPLTSGHSKARAHYMKAINTARRRAGGMKELNSMVLCSVERVLENYKTNMSIGMK